MWWTSIFLSEYSRLTAISRLFLAFIRLMVWRVLSEWNHIFAEKIQTPKGFQVAVFLTNYGKHLFPTAKLTGVILSTNFITESQNTTLFSNQKKKKILTIKLTLKLTLTLKNRTNTNLKRRKQWTTKWRHVSLTVENKPWFTSAHIQDLYVAYTTYWIPNLFKFHGLRLLTLCGWWWSVWKTRSYFVLYI